jgi:hypothetical protein
MGVELLGSSGNGMFSVPHRQLLKSSTGPVDRPSTSASSERRRSGAGGIRDKLSALTHRMREGSSSGLHEEEAAEAAEEGSPNAGNSKSSLGKRMSWAPSGRVKTG